MKKAFMILGVLAIAAGCNSVMGSFVKLKPDYADLPVDDLRQVADEIERAVARGDREAEIANRGAVVVDTDAIRQAIRTRAARRELVDAFLQTGFVWERRDGLLWVIPSKEYKRAGTRRDRDRNALLVSGENTDRWAIYEGIIKASSFSPRSLSALKSIFFEQHLKHMKTGQKYETEDGQAALIGGAS